MQLHLLAFKQGSLKLVVCDLGGQEEFHTFHHHTFSASSNGLFVVKLVEEHQQSQQVFERQLRYWLRFLVSHRRSADSTTSIKPKVFVLVNFFYNVFHKGMLIITSERAHRIIADVLSSRSHDAMSSASCGHFASLLGLAVIKIAQMQVVKRRLEILRKEQQQVVESGRLIPKLCSDIVEKVLPSLLLHKNVAVCNCFSLIHTLSNHNT
ncbi:hypothetical protein L7F22_013172 [Adiantum nelumboides]|nr:hypothetical protein [Adiantum nelumboides]